MKILCIFLILFLSNFSNAETIVLGSMDPGIINRILVEHLPQLRYCLEKELEVREMESPYALNVTFSIKDCGHVSLAGIDRSDSLHIEMKKCVIGVLKEIVFPKPLDGRMVYVKQTFNFTFKRSNLP